MIFMIPLCVIVTLDTDTMDCGMTISSPDVAGLPISNGKTVSEKYPLLSTLNSEEEESDSWLSMPYCEPLSMN